MPNDHEPAETNDTKPALPDRLSADPNSPYYNETVLALDVGVRFNGSEKNNVDEYCVSEGWIKVAVNNTLDRKGNPLLLTQKGTVEPYYRGGE
ncbi:MAG: DUF3297 family protein [Pseudomonadota bacterium]